MRVFAGLAIVLMVYFFLFNLVILYWVAVFSLRLPLTPGSGKTCKFLPKIRFLSSIQAFYGAFLLVIFLSEAGF